MDIVPWLALIVSIVSALFSYIAYRKASSFSEYEYSPRLELREECEYIFAQIGDKTYVSAMGDTVSTKIDVDKLAKNTAFAYQACLTNKGHKSLYIEDVVLEFGSHHKEKERSRHRLIGDLYLTKDEDKELEIIISRDDVDEAVSKFDLDECRFFLVVKYSSVNGEIKEIYRSLGGFTRDGVIHAAQKGPALS